MMVCASFCVGVNIHRASPEFVSTCGRTIDSSGASHAGGLRRIHIQLIAADYPHSTVTPIYDIV
jgi:hypothetical protein